MTTKTFKRFEIKYLISVEQFRAIKTALSEQMVADEYCKKTGSYMIYNLYFDTENDEVIRHSLDKPYYKEKLRLRSYTMPTCDTDTVFLELKKKIGGIVSKRRAIMTYIQATDFIDKGIFPELNTYEDRQVMKEIAAFMSRYGVKPKVFISYEREAFFEKTNPELRVSFDRNILTRRDNVSLKEGDFGIDLLEDDKVLMEIKCDGHIPLWLSSLLSEMKLFKTNFSKYGTEYQRFYSRYRLNKSA